MFPKMALPKKGFLNQQTVQIKARFVFSLHSHSFHWKDNMLKNHLPINKEMKMVLL